VWKFLKKVKKNWSHELKPAATTTKTKDTEVRAKQKTIRTADINASTMLPQWHCWNDKLSILFEPGHASRNYRHFQIISLHNSL